MRNCYLIDFDRFFASSQTARANEGLYALSRSSTSAVAAGDTTAHFNSPCGLSGGK